MNYTDKTEAKRIIFHVDVKDDACCSSLTWRWKFVKNVSESKLHSWKVSKTHQLSYNFISAKIQKGTNAKENFQSNTSSPMWKQENIAGEDKKEFLKVLEWPKKSDFSHHLQTQASSV